MIYETVFILSLVLMAVVLAAFGYVALNAKNEEPEYADVQSRSYALRSKFFWFLVVAGVIITAITTSDLPFAATRGDVSDVDRRISVSGGQWYWVLSESTAKVGETIVFDVTAVDVSHGLGVYDPQMQIVGQTQAMPGYTNSLKVTFDQEGTYKFLCLEYCGLAHHAMMAEFTVSQ